jgi:hypothetical protein
VRRAQHQQVNVNGLTLRAKNRNGFSKL